MAGWYQDMLESQSRRSSADVERQRVLQAIAEQDTQFQQQQQERQRAMGGRKALEQLLPQLAELMSKGQGQPQAGAQPPPAPAPQPPMPGAPSMPMMPPGAPQAGGMGQLPPPPGPGFATPPPAAPAAPMAKAAGPGAPPQGMPPPPGAQMPGMPPGGAPGAPPGGPAPPMPPQGWKGLPKPPEPAAAGPGGLPPPPEDAVMPRQQLSVSELAKFLDSKGVKGADALAAIEQWTPYMDKQNKAELDSMKVKYQAQTAAVKAYQQVLRDAEAARHHGALERQGEEKITAAKAKATATATGGENSDLTKDPETMRFMAEQYWAGDTSVLQNLGRGVQGSRNVVALRKEIQKVGKETGKSPKDLAAAMAEFQGMKAGERTLGARAANADMAVTEAQNTAKVLLDTSAKFNRSDFMPVNKALKAFEDKTGSTESREFGAALNTFINTYARAISPQGVPTVSDKEHAREILSTADSHEQLVGIMRVLKLEMEAARKAPRQVKEDMHSGFTGDTSREFASEEEAKAAGLKPGTKVKINGVSGTWQ